jgi:hypothetical protein
MLPAGYCWNTRDKCVLALLPQRTYACTTGMDDCAETCSAMYTPVLFHPPRGFKATLYVLRCLIVSVLPHPLQISLYDLNRVMAPGPSGPAIEPIVKFQDHKNLVTCLAPIGSSNPGVFVSGRFVFDVRPLFW